MEIELKKHKGIVESGSPHGHLEVANLADNPEMNNIVRGELSANRKLKRGIHNVHEL